MIDLPMLQDFMAETGEHLEEMETNLLKLEEDPGNREILNDIFRSAHTIKGSSEYLGMVKIARLSHKLETLLDMIRQGESILNREIIDVLISARDRIVNLVEDLDRTQTEETEIQDLVDRIEQLSAGHGDPREDQEETLTIEIKPEDFRDETWDHPETGDNPDQEVLTGAGDDETYDEEYDEELFGIFIKQLKENLSLLRTQIKAWPHPDNVGQVLDMSIESIYRLRSSANYMGYERLVLVYERWVHEIKKAQEALFSGEDVSLEPMKTYIDKIERLFPQVKELAVEGDAAKDSGDQGDGSLPAGLSRIAEEKFEGPAVDDGLSDALDSEEEQDEELFAIFIQQLKEGISLLNSHIDELRHSDNGIEIFDRCLECVDRLKASSNYMDYTKLCRVYENWRAEIEEVQKGLSSGEEASFEFMDAYIEKILAFFPNTVSLRVKGDKDEGPEDQDTGSPETEGSGDTGDGWDEEPVIPLVDEFLSNAVDNAFDSFLGQADGIEAVSSRGEWEEKLFSRSEPVPGGTEADKTPEEEVAVSPPEPEIQGEAQETGTEPPENKQRKDEPRQFDRPKSDRLAEKVFKQSIRVDARKIDSLMNQAGELVTNRAYFTQLFTDMREFQGYLSDSIKLEQKGMKQFRDLSFRLSEATVSLGRVANELQEGVMKMRMLPISQLFNRYPRLVRDLVRDTDKKVDLEIAGEETELDRVVIEEISDPLIHIIRNAVDHGIETVKERQGLGKTEAGRLKLEAYHESNHVVIEITDDGKGIDPDLIKATALEKNFLSREELDLMGPKELMGLIMRPGFSTTTRVTTTSGRGVGMDVVKKNIEKLNGTVELDSRVGEATRIRIKIPLTLAIIQALLVRVETEIFTIPLAAVQETLRIFKGETNMIEGVEVIHLRDGTLPLLRLAETFKMTADLKEPDKSFVVVVNTGVRQVGIVVDTLIGQEEVVIKPLEDYLQEDSGFSGATILGDGSISLILDIYELVNLSIIRQVKKRNYVAAMETPADNGSTEITGVQERGLAH